MGLRRRGKRKADGSDGEEGVERKKEKKTRSINSFHERLIFFPFVHFCGPSLTIKI